MTRVTTTRVGPEAELVEILPLPPIERHALETAGRSRAMSQWQQGIVSRELAHLVRNGANLRQRVEEISAALMAVNSDVHRYSQELRDQHVELASRRWLIGEIIKSSSWRLSAPLRMVAQVIRGRRIAATQGKLPAANPPAGRSDHDGWRERDSSDQAEAPVAKRTILVVADFPPMRDQSAGGLRLHTLIRMMGDAGWVVQVGSLAAVGSLPGLLGEPETRIAYETALQRDGVDNFFYGLEAIDEYLVRCGDMVDWVFVSFPIVAMALLPLVRVRCPGAMFAYDMVDFHSLRLLRQAALKDDEGLLEAAIRQRDMELACARAADVTIAVSEDEKDAVLELLPDVDIAVLPCVFDLPDGPIAPAEQRRDLLFIGGFWHQPNADAIIWFVAEIWPLVRAYLPDIKLSIVGPNADSEVCSLGLRPGIEFIGFVPDLDTTFAEHRVLIAPLRFGAGMKGKVAQSLSYGLPVVGTSIAAEGMGLVRDKHILVADQPDEFAANIIRLIEDDHLWQQMSRDGQAHIRQNFSIEVVNRTLLSVLEPERSIVARPAPEVVADVEPMCSRPTADLALVVVTERDITAQSLDRVDKLGRELLIQRQINHALFSQVARHDELIRTSQDSIAHMQVETGALRVAVADHERAIASLYGSTSWKSTLPLRAVSTTMKRVLAGYRGSIPAQRTLPTCHADLGVPAAIESANDVRPRKRSGLIMVAAIGLASDAANDCSRAGSLLESLREEGWEIVLAFIGEHVGEPLRQVNGATTRHAQPLGTTSFDQVLIGPEQVFSYLKTTGRALDRLYLSHPAVAAVLLPGIRRLCSGVRVIYDMGACGGPHSAFRLDEKNQTKMTTSPWFRAMAFTRAADVVITASDEEKAAVLDAAPDIVVRLVRTVVKASIPHPAGPEGRDGILFTADFAEPANGEAIRWFVGSILPSIRKALPGLVVRIAGSNVDNAVLALGSQAGIEILGFVHDQTSLYRRSRLFVAPLRRSGGFQAEVARSVVNGLPGVATPLGVEGLGLSGGTHALIAETEHDFAHSVLRLMTDDMLWNTLATMGRQHIEAEFSPAVVQQQLQAALHV